MKWDRVEEGREDCGEKVSPRDYPWCIVGHMYGPSGKSSLAVL